MTTQTRLRALALVLLPVAFVSACSDSQEPATDAEAIASSSRLEGHPVQNVVLVTIDTLRADAVGYAGKHPVKTPVLDRLASEGLVFEAAYAQNVVTLPAHANILTGLNPYQHGVRVNSGFRLPETLDTAATLFKESGFATGAVVGAFPLSSKYGLDRGFDRYDDLFRTGWAAGEFDMPERPGDQVITLAKRWWDENQGQRRFLWAHLYDPHTPYAPPEPFRSEYGEAPYLGEVAAVDSYLEPLLTPFLDGEMENTLIVVTSDHGEALREHGEPTHGFFIYEPTLRVPLVLWAPGLRGGEVADIARQIDLLPTMLEAAGLAVPDSLPGRSLLRDLPAGAETVTYIESLSPNLNRGWAPIRGVIRDNYKFISVPIPELYDIEADPGELDNLIDEEQQTVRELLRLLPDEDPWPPRRGQVTQTEMEVLMSLGYLSAEAQAKDTYTEDDDPKNLVEFDEQLHLAIEEISTGQLAAAEQRVRAINEKRPMAIAYRLLGQIQQESGQPLEAIATYEEAARAGIADRPLIIHLGLALSAVGRADEAVLLLEPLRAEGDTESLNALATALIETNRLDEAQQVLEESLALESEHPITIETMALVALRSGDWQRTKELSERVLAIDDSLSLSWNYLGGARYNLGDPPGAVEAWSKSVEHDPRNFDALYNIAVVANELGDYERVKFALRKFIAEAPPAQYGRDIEAARGWLAQLGG